MNYIYFSTLFQIGITITGLIFLWPYAAQEIHEPWISLWWEWATLHQDNDFEEVLWDWDRTHHHPEKWYDEEFEIWLVENGIDPSTREAYLGLCDLETYLLKHKFIKRMNYGNHWVYQINKDRLY